MEEQVKYTLDELKQKLIQLTMDYIDLRGRGNDSLKERLMLDDIKIIQKSIQLSEDNHIQDCTNCDTGKVEVTLQCSSCGKEY